MSACPLPLQSIWTYILIPQNQPLIIPRRLRRLSKVLRKQLLLLIEIVAGSLHLNQHPISTLSPIEMEQTHNINQSLKIPLPPLQQLRSIMRLPGLSILPQIPRKSLLTPRTLSRIRNRRKCTNALVHSRILQEQRQSPMSTHRMACYRYTARVQLREGTKECLGELGGYV
jgi:hypothetical protein